MDLTLTNIFITFSDLTQKLKCKLVEEMFSLLLLQNVKKNTLPTPCDKMAVEVQAAGPARLLPKGMPRDGKNEKILTSLLPTLFGLPQTNLANFIPFLLVPEKN